MKRIICILMFVCIFLSGCEGEMNYSEGTNIVKYKDCLYYYNVGEKYQPILTEKDLSTGEERDIDIVANPDEFYFTGPFFTNGKMMYYSIGVDNEWILYSMNLETKEKNVVAEYECNRQGMSIWKCSGNEKMIFGNDIYFFSTLIGEGGLYKISKGKLKLVTDKITDISMYDEYLYYADKNNEVYKYDYVTNKSTKIISREEIDKNEYMKCLGSQMCIFDIKEGRDCLYFAMTYNRLGLQGIMFLYTPDKGVQRVNAISGEYRIHKDIVYSWCFDEPDDNNEHRIISGKYKAFEIYEDTLYYLIPNENETRVISESKSLVE